MDGGKEACVNRRLSEPHGQEDFRSHGKGRRKEDPFDTQTIDGKFCQRNNVIDVVHRALVLIVLSVGQKLCRWVAGRLVAQPSEFGRLVTENPNPACKHPRIFWQATHEPFFCVWGIRQSAPLDGPTHAFALVSYCATCSIYSFVKCIALRCFFIQSHCSMATKKAKGRFERVRVLPTGVGLDRLSGRYPELV